MIKNNKIKNRVFKCHLHFNLNKIRDFLVCKNKKRNKKLEKVK